MKTLNRNVLLPVITGVIALVGMTTAQAQNERGRVISSTPIIQQVAVPREVCENVSVRERAHRSGAGALIGGIAGGAMGNAIGGGSGRAAATAIGLFGGAILGNHIEGRGQDRVRTVQECSTQTTYENQTVGYDVVYKYAGREYNMQMDQEPGRYIPVSVQPAVHVKPVTVRPMPRPVATYETQRAEPEVVYIGGYRSLPRHQEHRNSGRYERDDRDYQEYERDNRNSERWDRNWR